MKKVNKPLTYQERLDELRKTKLQHTLQKQKKSETSDINIDDHGRILPPADFVFKPESNHPTGGFFGPGACGKNFRALLESHPAYIHPMSSLAGGYMVYFLDYRQPHWKPELDWSHLKPEQEKYGIIHGIGKPHHFCMDLKIGLELGFGGLLNKVRHYRQINAPKSSEFYDGLEDILIGIQSWIVRHVELADKMASEEDNPQLKENLLKIKEINKRLVTDPPQTFYEACQWIAWYQMIARMYNGSGSLGALDQVLLPYYERDKSFGILTDDEAIFHLACLILTDPQYIQVGGVDASGKDMTNPVSFLILEAVHQIKIPANVAVCVHDKMDDRLLHRAVEILFEDKLGFPKFIGIKNLQEGFVKNGYPLELACQRVYSGCHWLCIPGREYTQSDVIKINFAKVFDVALREMVSDPDASLSVSELWNRFEKHLRNAINVVAKGIDYHREHMHEIFPELVLDLLCHGPIEKGLDVTNGGVEYYNICVDGAGLATTADSFAAIEQIVEKEKLLTWQELIRHLDENFKDEKIRLLLKNIPRYGSGERADEWAKIISQIFTKLLKEKPTPSEINMIPGLFSWVSHVEMGKTLGATPNGRYAYTPISFGCNPDPGFLKGTGAPTALVIAVASVQPGYGNTAPLQLDIDPGMGSDKEILYKFESLIKGHFALGGTLINVNILNKQQILDACKDPLKYPDLIVRVTGFSAYFACLSKELRQSVVERILAE